MRYPIDDQVQPTRPADVNWVIARRRCLAWALIACLGGCAGAFNLPPEHRPQSYTVHRGDTLYSIAWHYGLNYHQVAKWNGIGPPYKILPGQRVYLYPGHSASTQRSAGGANKTSVVVKLPGTPDRSKSSSGAVATASSKVSWRWPAKGKTLNSFGKKGVAGKGIIIQGQFGESVVAAAKGTVVYAGSALVGYGRLIIVKHNDEWLSAYGHNHRLLVHEGETVSAGQKIATMGRAPDGKPALYFEIRENGSPVNPLRFLSSKR